MAKNSLPIATENSTPKPDKEWEARERQYRAEEGLRTFEKAEEFRRDKECMKDIKQLAKTKIKNLGKIK